MTTSVRFVLSYDFKKDFYRLQSVHTCIFNENIHFVTDIVNDVLYSFEK